MYHYNTLCNNVIALTNAHILKSHAITSLKKYLLLRDDIPLNDLPGFESGELGDFKICLEDFMDLDDPLCYEDDSGKVLYSEYNFGGSYDLYITYTGDGSNDVGGEVPSWRVR